VLLFLQVIDATGGVSWDDIAGLETAKNLIKEIVVWPMLNPELFTVSFFPNPHSWHITRYPTL
jgi:SpoVK/Ycf46/Vps4 family AAA+-type ATPase